MNIIVRRRDVQVMIDDDPSDVTVYRRAEVASASPTETSWECVGRVQPAGSRGRATEQLARGMPGEHAVGRYTHVLLLPYDEEKLIVGDEVETSYQLYPAVTKSFRVVYSTQYTYKIEVLLDELS